MTVTVAQFAALLIAGLLFLYLASYRLGWIAAAVISVAGLLDCFGVGRNGLGLAANLYIDDVANVVLLLVGLLSVLRYRRIPPPDVLPCFALLALVAVNLFRGAAVYGIRHAGNSARHLLTFVVPALAIMLLRPYLQLSAVRLAKWLIWAGCALCAVAILRWAGFLPQPFYEKDTFREVVRALPSDYAIVIGQAFIAILYLMIAGRHSPRWWAIASMLGAVTLLLQHRSVWVATAAGLAWLLFRTGRSGRRGLAVGFVGVV